MGITVVSTARAFGGQMVRFSHAARSTSCDMHCSVFLPPQAERARVPVFLWLSGLTCTDENFMTKSGAQRVAAAAGVALVAPDTSPRGDGVPDDPEGAYDFGLGAGFYVNATQDPWRRHYQMERYVVEELPQLLHDEFSLDIGRLSLSGHSMGGHGALTLALKNPGLFRAVSAFSPIASPMECPWGQKALTGYLGDGQSNQSAWQRYDACHLVAQESSRKFHLQVEQGSADAFLQEQLKPHLLQDACAAAEYPLTLNMREGYDHSYYFIASFIEEYVAQAS